MAKNRSTLHLNGEAVGNGGIRYVKGSQSGEHSPASQENVHLTQSYKQYIPQLLGSVAAIIDPNADQASEYWLYNATPHYTQVNVIRDAEGNFTTYTDVQKANSISNGVYSVMSQNENRQILNTMGVPAQWKEEGDKWKYWNGIEFAKAAWVLSKGYWYYLGEDEYMVTGWLDLEGKRYYLKTKAEDTEGTGHYGYMMSHRWRQIDNTWYYFHTDGSMMKDGWRMDAAQKEWYYCGSNGEMAVLQVIPWKGKSYYVGKDGAMVKNTKITDPNTGETYTADGNGVLSKNKADMVFKGQNWLELAEGNFPYIYSTKDTSHSPWTKKFDATADLTFGIGHSIKNASEFQTIKTFIQNHTTSVIEAEVQRYLQSDLADSVTKVNAFIKDNNVKLEQNQFDAIVSLVFNYPGALSKTTDLGKELINNGSSGNFDESNIVDGFTYTRFQGSRIDGLVTRRNNELNLFFSADYNNYYDTKQKVINAGIDRIKY